RRQIGVLVIRIVYLQPRQRRHRKARTRFLGNGFHSELRLRLHFQSGCVLPWLRLRESVAVWLRRRQLSREYRVPYPSYSQIGNMPSSSHKIILRFGSNTDHAAVDQGPSLAFGVGLE